MLSRYYHKQNWEFITQIYTIDHIEIYNLGATPFDRMELNWFKTNGI